MASHFLLSSLSLFSQTDILNKVFSLASGTFAIFDSEGISKNQMPENVIQ